MGEGAGQTYLFHLQQITELTDKVIELQPKKKTQQER